MQPQLLLNIPTDEPIPAELQNEMLPTEYREMIQSQHNRLFQSGLHQIVRVTGAGVCVQIMPWRCVSLHVLVQNQPAQYAHATVSWQTETKSWSYMGYQPHAPSQFTGNLTLVQALRQARRWVSKRTAKPKSNDIWQAEIIRYQQPLTRLFPTVGEYNHCLEAFSEEIAALREDLLW